MICVSFLICCDNLDCQTFLTLGSWLDAETMRHVFHFIALMVTMGFTLQYKHKHEIFLTFNCI